MEDADMDIESFVKQHPTMWEDLLEASKYLENKNPIIAGALKRYSDEIKEIDLNRPFEPFKKSNKEYFEITSVSREDLEDVGFDTSNVTDEQMERLAQKMADDYLEQLFWSSMEIIAEDVIGIPKVR